MKTSALLAAAVLLLAATPAFAQRAAVPHAPFACPATHLPAGTIDHTLVMKLFTSLKQAFEGALGPDAAHLDQDKVLARVASHRVDDAHMAALAEVSGCAALVDRQSSCANFFDPELGDPLSVFMGMKKSAPVRRQFEASVAKLTDSEQRRAAQYCIGLVGKR